MATADCRPTARRHAGCDRARQAQGVPRWILLHRASGSSLFFVILAIFAPLIAPYGFDQVDRRRRALPQAGTRPTATHLFGTTVQSTDVLSRVIWGSRTAIEVVVLAVVFSLVDRRAARPGLRLRRRQARPRAGADHRRALRLPLPAARDRDRVPALRHVRPGGASRPRSRSPSSTSRSTSGWSATT